jgi:hypothetical protein
MHAVVLRKDAEACRELASQFNGKPEEAFLFRAAEALQELADRNELAVHTKAAQPRLIRLFA